MVLTLPGTEGFKADCFRRAEGAGGGRLVFRDMASNSRLVMWLVNHIEMPVINKILRKGDVHAYTRADIQRLCDVSGLKLERYEVRKGFRLHCVVRKPG